MYFVLFSLILRNKYFLLTLFIFEEVSLGDSGIMWDWQKVLLLLLRYL